MRLWRDTPAKPVAMAGSKRRSRRATTFAALAGLILCALGPPYWMPQFMAPPTSSGGRSISTKNIDLALAATASTGSGHHARPANVAPKVAGSQAHGLLGTALVAAVAFGAKAKLATGVSASAGTVAATAPPKTKRIDAFDSMRFFLISYIVCGHFISFAKPSALPFKLITQINVVVGAFFALSGYVAAYTMTELGQRKAKDKVVSTPAPAQTVAKIFGYFPLHFVVLLIFSPMFIYADSLYNGPLTMMAHALMAVTMTQAWFPGHAEIWNAPTWFLGALTFATVLQPYFMPVLAKQGKKELRRTAFWITLFGLIPRLGYCYDTNGWGLLEGAMAPKAFANLWAFNAMRFNPCWAVMEVMLGVVACRLVMLDGADGEPAPKVSVLDTILPCVGMLAVLYLRATGMLALSDMLTRSCIFMPLFLLFLMGLHRASLPDKVTDPIAKFLAWKPLTWLGGLSFPIFVVHGPVGQLFYKKAIATKIFGGTMNAIYGPWFFYVYLLVVLSAAWLLNTFFMKSKRVGEWSKAVQSKILPYC